MVLLYYRVSYGIIIQCHIVLVPRVKHFQTEGNWNRILWWRRLLCKI